MKKGVWIEFVWLNKIALSKQTGPNAKNLLRFLYLSVSMFYVRKCSVGSFRCIVPKRASNYKSDSSFTRPTRFNFEHWIVRVLFNAVYFFRFANWCFYINWMLWDGAFWYIYGKNEKWIDHGSMMLEAHIQNSHDTRLDLLRIAR